MQATPVLSAASDWQRSPEVISITENTPAVRHQSTDPTRLPGPLHPDGAPGHTFPTQPTDDDSALVIGSEVGRYFPALIIWEVTLGAQDKIRHRMCFLGTTQTSRRRANEQRNQSTEIRELHGEIPLPTQVFDHDSTYVIECPCPVLDDESGLVADASHQKSAADLRASRPEHRSAGTALMSGCGGDSKANGDDTGHPSPPKARVTAG